MSTFFIVRVRVDFKYIYFLFTFSEVVIDRRSEKKEDSNGSFEAPSFDQATEYEEM